MLLQTETQTWVLIVEGPVTCFLCRCVETEASALESSILLPYDVCKISCAGYGGLLRVLMCVSVRRYCLFTDPLPPRLLRAQSSPLEVLSYNVPLNPIMCSANT